MFMSFSERERGHGTAEYGLILVLVAIIIIALLVLLREQIGEFISEIVEAFNR